MILSWSLNHIRGCWNRFSKARKLLESPSSTTITMDFPGLQPGLQTHKLSNFQTVLMFSVSHQISYSGANGCVFVSLCLHNENATLPSITSFASIEIQKLKMYQKRFIVLECDQCRERPVEGSRSHG